MARDTAEELERFRRQWQEEVTARSSKAVSSSSATKSKFRVPTQRPERQSQISAPLPQQSKQGQSQEISDDWEHGYHDLDNKDEPQRLGEASSSGYPTPRKEPTSALDHYERAVERESDGNLGDSLNHYRKAYRLDAGVDRLYRNKHHPPTAPSKTIASTNPPDTPVTVPNSAHHSFAAIREPIPQLIASFSSQPILGEEPPTDASPPPPCPMSTIPSELLTEILVQAGLKEPASLARLAVVCKRLAYLVATEDQVWRNIVHDNIFGFGAMHYDWACTITGSPLPMSIDDLDTRIASLSLSRIPVTLPLTTTFPSYRHMYHTRPRIRFTGCYISTVNYIRPGAATASQATWNSPVLIVTYYRYLRFFRDGSCASLLTTVEPVDVVHHLTKENMQTKNHPAGLPGAVMNHALKGRWRLSGDPYGFKEARRRHADDGSGQEGTYESAQPPTKLSEDQAKDTVDGEEDEGTVHIETEGADAGAPNPKYVYKMMLKLQSTGGGGQKAAGKTRNNKMAWLGYWSYNKLTDDWAEFGLRNDRAFFWSRVKSYGSGE